MAIPSRFSNPLRSSRGNSLVLAMAATLTLAQGIHVMTLYFKSQMTALKTFHTLSAKKDLRLLISAAHDCAATLAVIGTTCPTPPNYVPLLRKNNTQLVTPGPTYTKIGNFEIRASCTSIPTGKQFPIEIRSIGTTTWQPLYSSSDIPPSC